MPRRERALLAGKEARCVLCNYFFNFLDVFVCLWKYSSMSRFSFQSLGGREDYVFGCSFCRFADTYGGAKISIIQILRFGNSFFSVHSAVVKC